MAYVVTEACIGCRYGECAKICPVAAFHAGPNFMAIDPVACINCAICELVCPVGAIVADVDLAEGMQAFKGLNARLARIWPVAVDVQPLPGADALARVPGKRGHLVVPEWREGAAVQERTGGADPC